MGFWQAIVSGFSNYVSFSGRAVRSEYWYWTLFVFLCDVAALLIDTAIGVYVVSSLVHLAVLLPSVGLFVRRLHDLDRSAWWWLIALIPIVGWIVLIIWFCTKGTLGSNRFGPDRLAAIAQS
jgi:uncharacterized membrane protein YhaH (DUF805 family)